MMMLCPSCGSPPRPAAVPADSTWVEGGEAGWWQRCNNTDVNTTHCTVWNRGGEILLDEAFLPMDGGPKPSSESLKLRGEDAMVLCTETDSEAE
jgi:hypothetical protein